MNYAIVLAGGSGKRMNMNVKKQYLEIQGKPLLFYTLNAFEKSEADRIILVTSKEDIQDVKENIVEKYNIDKVERIVEGGKERYNSVYNALASINDADLVLVHDGARPFVDVDVINRTIECAKCEKAAIAAVRVKDTIKRSNNYGQITETIKREDLWQIQTPQTFNFKKIKAAYEELIENNDVESVTDDSMVWERVYPNYPVKIIESNYFNIKITTKEDLLFANAIVGR